MEILKFLKYIFLLLDESQRTEFVNYCKKHKNDKKQYPSPEEFLADLSPKARNILERYMHFNYKHPMLITSRELRNLPNCGPKIQKEIQQHFIDLGLVLKP